MSTMLRALRARFADDTWRHAAHLVSAADTDPSGPERRTQALGLLEAELRARPAPPTSKSNLAALEMVVEAALSSPPAASRDLASLLLLGSGLCPAADDPRSQRIIAEVCSTATGADLAAFAPIKLTRNWLIKALARMASEDRPEEARTINAALLAQYPNDQALVARDLLFVRQLDGDAAFVRRILDGSANHLALAEIPRVFNRIGPAAKALVAAISSVPGPLAMRLFLALPSLSDASLKKAVIKRWEHLGAVDFLNAFFTVCAADRAPLWKLARTALGQVGLEILLSAFAQACRKDRENQESSLKALAENPATQKSMLSFFNSLIKEKNEESAKTVADFLSRMYSEDSTHSYRYLHLVSKTEGHRALARNLLEGRGEFIKIQHVERVLSWVNFKACGDLLAEGIAGIGDRFLVRLSLLSSMIESEALREAVRRECASRGSARILAVVLDIFKPEIKDSGAIDWQSAAAALDEIEPGATSAVTTLLDDDAPADARNASYQWFLARGLERWAFVHMKFDHAISFENSVVVFDQCLAGDRTKLLPMEPWVLVRSKDRREFKEYSRLLHISGDFWYQDSGWEHFQQASVLCRKLCNAALQAGLIESSILEALSIGTIRAVIEEFYILQQTARLLREGVVSKIVVRSTDHEFIYRVYAATHSGDGRSQAPLYLWQVGLPYRKQPSRYKTNRAERAFHVASSATSRAVAAEVTLHRLREKLANVREVTILFGSVGKPQHSTALSELVLESQRCGKSVLVLLLGRSTTPEFEHFVEKFSKYRPENLPSVTVLGLSDSISASRHVLVSEQIDSLRKLKDFDISDNYSVYDAAADKALSYIYSEAGSLLYMDKYFCNILDSLSSGTSALCINLTGTNPFSSLLLRACKDRGIPTCDSYIFTIANSARQFPSVADFISVVDTVQVEFVSERWGVPPQNVLATGYLGLPKLEPTLDALNSDFEARPVRNILVATQAEFDTGNALMIQHLGAAARERRDLSVALRLHPREPSSAYGAYADILRHHGLPASSIRKSDEPLPEAIAAADLVLTQTSNVGIEAAAMGRFVVKDLTYSSFLDQAIIETPYSFNILQESVAVEELQAALSDLNIQSRTLERSNRYLERNPGLLSGGGAAILLSWLGKVASRSGPPALLRPEQAGHPQGTCSRGWQPRRSGEGEGAADQGLDGVPG